MKTKLILKAFHKEGCYDSNELIISPYGNSKTIQVVDKLGNTQSSYTVDTNELVEALVVLKAILER